MKCDNCNNEVAIDSIYCGICGNKINNNKYFCSNCGNKFNDTEYFCKNCGTKKELVADVKSQKPTTIKQIMKFINQNKKNFIITFASLFIIFLGFVLYRSFTNYFYEKNIHYSFKVNGEEFKIGKKVSYYEEKGYTYKDKYYNNTNIIVPDGFIPHVFYKGNEAVMYAAIHCREKENCHYSDGNIVKINFYKNIGEIMLADFIKIGTSYEEIVSKLGEPDGNFYMNNSEYVWSFYEKGKINNPYYVLKFDNLNKVVDMKIGMWWYDGEYEYTIKK